ncbi:MAG: N-6 DNA methylase [Thermodesulfovibrionales bacterium]
MRKLKEIFNRLGMNAQNGLYINAEEKWRGVLSPRIGWLIEEKLKPVAFFCIDKKPIVLFYDSPQNKEELFKAIWNFNESPIVIINEPNAVDIFNGFSYLKEKKTLNKLEEDSNKLNAFSYFELVTGKTWQTQTYANKLKYKNKVDYHLLEDIRSARDLLINEHKITPYLSNALIGKCIFIRYLIDRKVRIGFPDGNLRKWTKDEFCKLLENKNQTINFLKYLKGHFNEEAFLADDSDLQKIPKDAFGVLNRLMRGTKITTGQESLFDIYDFSIIPVEFISNVYEHFIGSENQAESGAYYTPLFLVEYILSETVEKFFDENPKEYNCKVLDPACGSGIFLVEALRRIIEQYNKINNITSANSKSFKKTLKEIAENNIYGIDNDKGGNAINVAIFSVYLALLDYLKDPKDIENFTFPSLKSRNFFDKDFFDLDAEFNKEFKGIKFDFIIGNPPWKRGSNEEALFVKYIDQRKKKESANNASLPQISIGNKEIAQAFLLRTSDFSTAQQTRCALIVTSKTLYNLNAEDFRSYFLKNYYIDSVFELAPVGTEVFQSANTPAVVLFYRCSFGSETNKNIVKHIVIKRNRLFSLFNIFALQRNDCKNVAQKKLRENDWLWKVLIWGSYLDFNFIKRLKNGHIPINGAIGKNNLLVGQGIIIGDKDKKYNVNDLIGKPLIDHKKDIKQFHVCASLLWTEEKVTRDRNKELFKAPILLIKHGLKRLKAVAAISNSDVLYQHSLTGIKGDIAILRTLCGLLNSDLFSYYMIHASVAGIDRGRAHDEEKFDFPYISNIQITEYVKKIEVISKRIFEQKQNILNSKLQLQEDEKQHLLDDLNDEILKSFDLNEQEKTLVDYAVTITIPLIMKHDDTLFTPLKFEAPFLKDYAEIFISRFKSSLEKCKKAFRIQILHNNYIIGMFFRVTNQAKKSESVSWENKSDDEMLLKLSSLGYQKITENLFIQKDIRGFENEGFYIIKPNEKKLWHKAIAYLDADEFADAMLKEGGKVEHGV